MTHMHSVAPAIRLTASAVITATCLADEPDKPIDQQTNRPTDRQTPLTIRFARRAGEA